MQSNSYTDAIGSVPSPCGRYARGRAGLEAWVDPYMDRIVAKRSVIDRLDDVDLIVKQIAEDLVAQLRALQPAWRPAFDENPTDEKAELFQ